MRKVILLISSCEKHYLNMLLVFLMSYKEHNGDCDIWLDLLNPTQKAVRRIKKVCPEVHITNVIMKTTKEMIAPYRTNQVLRATDAGYKKILWIDTDTIIRASIVELWDISPGEIKIIFRPKKRPHYRSQGGVIVFGVNKDIKKYWEAVCKKSNYRMGWFSSQTYIYKLHKNFDIKHIQLPIKYNDSKFNDDSTVWHSKGTHFGDPKFQEEFKYYLGKANEIIDA